MIHRSHNAFRKATRLALLVGLGELAAAAVASGPLPLLFKSDLGIPNSTHVEGIDKFAQFMASLSTPLLIALAAVAPIALIFGAGALMFGNRRALTIIASTVGALAIAASATGLIN